MRNYVKYYNTTKYPSYYKKYEVNDLLILLESQKGKNLNGNVFYLLKELLNNKDYSKYKVYLSVDEKSKDKFIKLLDRYHLHPQLVGIESKQYFQLLSQAKYLITDTSFTPNYVKKDDQIILNVWHGTPLKTLGKKDNSGYHSLGNIQKNFVIADYLLYPNEYMMNHMIEDYMLENICHAQCLLSGYPRNEIFFTEPNLDIIKYLKLEGKQVIGYMPTWRGSVGNVDEGTTIDTVVDYLYEIDKRLDNNQVLLVNLHPFIQSQIHYDSFQKIIPFPEQYETYEVLNICDMLITDYSSVFFDYANTRKKIILFAYDLEEYLIDRGLYISLDSLPFPIVKTVDDLINQINSSKEYDDTSFLKTYCYKDNQYASSNLLKYVFQNEKGIVDVKNINDNQKNNVLIYAGNLAKNGITTALLNILNHVDLEKRNYYITYYISNIEENKEIILNLPDGVNYIPMMGRMNASLFQKIFLIFVRRTRFVRNFHSSFFDNLYKMEIRRCFHNIHFSDVIQYNGYEFKPELMFGRFPSNRVIYVHNNMVEEIKSGKAQHPYAISYAYNHYDKVAIVTEDMRKPTQVFAHDNNKICLARNIINYQEVLSKSKEEIKFDLETESTHDVNDLKKILNNSHKVFITIGRFSPEKGHKRLLDAFDQLWKKDNHIYLIIIGGYGNSYMETIEYKDHLESKENIVIIKYVSNPYSILKQCDYFVLPSFHEGFGLVLAESDILGIPVISTDILGPRGFMNENHGYLVENSTDGILHGMECLLNGQVESMNVDYENYNKQAVNEFENLLKTIDRL